MKHCNPSEFEVPEPPYDEPHIEAEMTVMECLWVFLPIMIFCYFFLWKGALAILSFFWPLMGF